MKRIIFITLCLTMSLTAMAQWNQRQQGGDRRQFSPEQYKQELEKFVSHEAGLTETESQRLFPMIHEMMEKERKNNMEATRLMQACNDNSSEAEYEQAIKKCLALEIDNKTIEQTYYKKFHSVLTWKKIVKVRTALFRFNMYSLSRFSPHRGGFGNGNNGNNGNNVNGRWPNNRK